MNLALVTVEAGAQFPTVLGMLVKTLCDVVHDGLVVSTFGNHKQLVEEYDHALVVHEQAF